MFKKVDSSSDIISGLELCGSALLRALINIIFLILQKTLRHNVLPTIDGSPGSELKS